MPHSCSAYGCTKRFEKGSGISFFKFPLQKPKELSKWLHAVKRKNFSPKSTDRLCSLHFKSDDIILSPGVGLKLLKPGVVPSIFEGFPKHLQPKKNCTCKTRNIVWEEIIEESVQSMCNEEPMEEPDAAFTPNVLNKFFRCKCGMSCKQIIPLRHKLTVVL